MDTATQAQTVALARLTGFGLGSRIVGSESLPGGSVATICEICRRCDGEGFKNATLIAGKWVGGDNQYLCERCRGAGARSFVLFPAQQATLAARLL